MQHAASNGSTRTSGPRALDVENVQSKGENRVKSWWMGCAAALAVALAGCGSGANCNDACNKLQSCNLNSSGFSCDSNCGSPDDTCANCLNGTSCADITAGHCATDCPDATFTPK